MNREHWLEQRVLYEYELIEKKVRLGEDGLEWLINHNGVDKKEHIERYKAIMTVFPVENLKLFMKDVLTMSPEEFEALYDRNWKITAGLIIDELTAMRQNNPEEFIETVNYIYGK